MHSRSFVCVFHRGCDDHLPATTKLGSDVHGEAEQRHSVDPCIPTQHCCCQTIRLHNRVVSSADMLLLPLSPSSSSAGR